MTTIAVTLGALLVPLAPSAEAAPVSSSHPYSDPLYLPLRSGFGVDCVRNNPGCKNPHNFWGMDIVPTGQFGGHGHTSHAGVFAMGAGILHYGDAHGSSCGHGSSYGTWVWIDHGAGVVTRYGHLSRIAVHNGARVSAGEQIGTVGTTGKNANCSVSYLDFQVQHNGLSSQHTVQFTTLRACVGSRTTQVWPRQAASTKAVGNSQRVHYSIWNKVHQGTQFPAGNGSCLSGSAPATAPHPGGTRTRHSGSGRVSVSWAIPAAKYHAGTAMVELSLFHPGSKRWDSADQERYRTTPVSRKSFRFGGLGTHHTYRARVSFHNGAGWSRASSWQTVQV